LSGLVWGRSRHAQSLLDFSVGFSYRLATFFHVGILLQKKKKQSTSFGSIVMISLVVVYWPSKSYGIQQSVTKAALKKKIIKPLIYDGKNTFSWAPL